MTKPTHDELATALAAAGSMKEHDKDPDFIAKALLNSHYREQYLEKVFHLAERYIKFGQGETEHRELIRAIEMVRDEELRIDKKKTRQKPWDYDRLNCGSNKSIFDNNYHVSRPGVNEDIT